LYLRICCTTSCIQQNLQQIYNKSNNCTTSLQHSTKCCSFLYNKSTTNRPREFDLYSTRHWQRPRQAPILSRKTFTYHFSRSGRAVGLVCVCVLNYMARFTGLSYGISMIVRLAVLVERRLVTDRQTDGHTDRRTDTDHSIYRVVG